MPQNTISLLRECSAGIKMGMASIDEVLESESRLDVEALVEAAVKSQEIVNIIPE